MESLTYPAKQFREIIQATFPDYKRREVRIEATEKVTFYGVNWSGGSRNEYRACTIDGKPYENQPNMGGPAPWNNPYEGLTVNLPENVVIVEGGYFCGKTKLLRIYCHPTNMPRLLPDAAQHTT